MLSFCRGGVKGDVIFCETTEFGSPHKRLSRQSKYGSFVLPASFFEYPKFRKSLTVPLKRRWFGYLHAKKMKLDPYLTQYTKVKSRRIVDLNVRGKTITLIKENISVNICDLGLSNLSSHDTKDILCFIKIIIDILGFIKIQIVLQMIPSKEKPKRHSVEWEKIFANPTSNRDLYSEYIKCSYNSIIKRHIAQFKNEQRM